MGRPLLLIYFLLIYIKYGLGLGTVWEFGKDHRNSIVISNNEGEISLDQKTKRVTFPVPSCYETVYVRVDVQNEYATPSVRYMKDTNTVVISYRAKQRSLSEYNVIAKAVQLDVCSQKKRDSKKYKNKSITLESEEYEEYQPKSKYNKRAKNRKDKLSGKKGFSNRIGN